MKAGYLFLASFAGLSLAGWPLLAHAGYRCLSLPARIGLSFAAGAVLLSGWMTALALAGIAWQPAVLALLAAATAFLLRLGLSSDRAPVEPPQAEGPPSVLERSALFLPGLSVLVVFAAAASSAASSPDLVSFWGAKAQAFAAARTIDAPFLREPALLYMHPSYPPLVTNLMAFASRVAGRFPWGAATLTLPMLLAVLALALPGVLRLAAPRRLAWASSALILAALGYLGHALFMAGNADPWLWTFEILAMAILIGPAARTRAGQLLAGLLLAGTVTAKVEGLLVAAAVVPLFLVLRRREIRLLPATPFLILPGVVSLGAWFWFEASRRIFFGYEQYGRFLEVRWDRLPLVLSQTSRVLWSNGWGLPFLLPLFALLLAPGRPAPALGIPLGVSLAVCAFSLFTYLHGAEDPSLWIEWSAGRIFSPAFAFLPIAALCRRRG